MSAPLKGRVVLVTGGGRGIGRSHCRALAQLGAAVVVNDPGVGRDGAGRPESVGLAATVVDEIERAGGTAIAHTGSVASWEDAADMVRIAVDTFGTLTGVVNNAGILRDATVVSMSESDWDAVLGVHLKGTVAVTHHACNYWRDQFKADNRIAARVVNTVSGTGLWGNIGQSAYGAAKAAVANFTAAVALEADRYGVTANAISPLAISRMTEQLLADRADDPALDPGRSSAVVAWLQSVESAWLTGQILRINGDKLTRIHGFTEGHSRYHAADGVALQFSEIGNAVRWLWDTFPRGLAGPLPQR